MPDGYTVDEYATSRCLVSFSTNTQADSCNDYWISIADGPLAAPLARVG